MTFDQNLRDCEPKNKVIAPSKMTVSGFLFAVVCFVLFFCSRLWPFCYISVAKSWLTVVRPWNYCSGSCCYCWWRDHAENHWSLNVDTAGLASGWLSLALLSAWKVQRPEESAGHAKPHQLEITYKAVWISPQSLPSGRVQMLTWFWNGAALKTLNTRLSHSFKGKRLVPEVCL